MRSNLLPEIQIKAAGGIRSHAEAVQMLQAGAARLGTSSGIKIIEEASR
jgi:deoxyribose-phosphate aldolase